MLIYCIKKESLLLSQKFFYLEMVTLVPSNLGLDKARLPKNFLT